jgi:hypothetical protein
LILTFDSSAMTTWETIASATMHTVALKNFTLISFVCVESPEPPQAGGASTR